MDNYSFQVHILYKDGHVEIINTSGIVMKDNHALMEAILPDGVRKPVSLDLNTIRDYHVIYGNSVAFTEKEQPSLKVNVVGSGEKIHECLGIPDDRYNSIVQELKDKVLNKYEKVSQEGVVKVDIPSDLAMLSTIPKDANEFAQLVHLYSYNLGNMNNPILRLLGG